MVERLGHKKRIQMMRMDWINEGKPRESVHEDSIFDDPVLPPRQNSNNDTAATKIAPIFERNLNEREKTPGLFVDAEDDIYNATPRIARAEATALSESNQGSSSLFGPRRTIVPDEPEDDLDAFLAEQEIEAANATTGAGAKTQDYDMTVPEQNYDDDMEAMAEMGLEW
jgi:replication fork protection complex subunit Csm3/Swi3